MKPDPNEHLGTSKEPDTYSRRRFSMNSGLNLSPVTYSADDEKMSELADGSRTKSMLVWKRWDDACGKAVFEMVPKENEVLEASPG